MNVNKMSRNVIAFALIIGLNIAVVNNFSDVNATEILKPRFVDASNENINSLNLLLDEHSANINNQRKKSLLNPEDKRNDAQQSTTGWNNKLQPYIEAHRKFWSS
jgi:hypothetical protein